MIKGIDHIGLSVADLERSLAFYRDLLGFELLRLLDCDPQLRTLEYGTTHGLLHTFSEGRTTYLYAAGVTIESLRPIVALASGWGKDQAWPRVYAQAVTPVVPGRMARCDYARDMRWRWYDHSHRPMDGAIAITPCDLTPGTPGRYWWVLGRDGLYRLDQEHATCVQVLESTVELIRQSAKREV